MQWPDVFLMKTSVVDTEISAEACEACRGVKVGDLYWKISDQVNDELMLMLTHCEISCPFRPLCQTVEDRVAIVVIRLVVATLLLSLTCKISGCNVYHTMDRSSGKQCQQ